MQFVCSVASAAGNVDKAEVMLLRRVSSWMWGAAAGFICDEEKRILKDQKTQNTRLFFFFFSLYLLKMLLLLQDLSLFLLPGLSTRDSDWLTL